MDCLIIDDQPVVLVGLRAIIACHFPQWRCRSADSMTAALHRPGGLEEAGTNMILLGLNAMSALESELLGEFLQAAAQRHLRTLVLARQADSASMTFCQRNGALGFALKSESVGTLVHAIDVVSSGGRYFNCTERLHPHPQPGEAPRFTERQKDILDLLLLGCSNKRIADQLNLTPGTVKNYIFDLMRLLSVNSRLELAMKVKELGYEGRPERSSEAQARPPSIVVPSGHLLRY